jgi:hypothetical protein
VKEIIVLEQVFTNLINNAIGQWDQPGMLSIKLRQSDEADEQPPFK